MIFSEEIGVILRATIGFVLLVILFNKYWRESRIDDFRHRLFMVRADLFDYARNGEIGFRDPAYTMLRENINSMLRFAHKITLTRFLVITVFSRSIISSELVEQLDREWNDAIRQLKSEAVRRQLTELHERALFEVCRHMVLGSVSLFLFLSNVALLHALWQGLRRFLLHKARIVEAEARFSRQAPVAA